jgi:hypothetical protein
MKFDSSPISVLRTDTPTPDNWLLPSGTLRLMPAAEIDQWPHPSRQLWCHLHGRYGLPTAETVAWLRDRIAGRRAIEIGSGAGDLAFHLGSAVDATDSKIQDKPLVRRYYAAVRQPVIKYPAWVMKLDAQEAIRQFNPEVVIGCWITHWVDAAQPLPPSATGSVFGVREDRIIASGIEYIMIGNLAVHATKPILRDAPHLEIQLPFIRSRAARPDLERVFIWNGE